MADLFALDVFEDVIQVSDGDSNLVLEEPTNGRTVEEILGARYELRTFIGHVTDDRDVRRGGSGDDPENRFPDSLLPPPNEDWVDPTSSAGGRGGEV